jgi:subtilisin
MADTELPAWSRGESIYQPVSVTPLPALTAEWAWGSATGAGVRVAVIDSGVDFEHPLVNRPQDAGNGLAISLDAEGQLVEERGPHEDLYGHGTAVAGIIHSLAPEAQITSVRVLGAALTGKAQVFLRGLAWAVEQGFDIVNLSLSTPKRDWAVSFYEMCDLAYFRKVFVVASANNNPVVSFPALFSSVASVGCNPATKPFEFHFNPNPPTEFLARGVDVEVAWLDRKTIRATGNSFATPHIAGIAALICSKHPGIRPSELKSTLLATAANRYADDVVAGLDLHMANQRGLSARTMSAIRPALIATPNP